MTDCQKIWSDNLENLRKEKDFAQILRQNKLYIPNKDGKFKEIIDKFNIMFGDTKCGFTVVNSNYKTDEDLIVFLKQLSINEYGNITGFILNHYWLFRIVRFAITWNEDESEIEIYSMGLTPIEKIEGGV